jgi:hypothetical protein
MCETTSSGYELPVDRSASDGDPEETGVRTPIGLALGGGVALRPDRGDGVLNPPSLDVAGDLECVQRCWGRFPDGRILTAWSLASFTKPGDL